MYRLVVALLLIFQVCAAQAAVVTVKNLRMWQAPNRTRLVLELSAPVKYRTGIETDRRRAYLDLQRARLAQPLPAITGGRFLVGIHSVHPRPGVLRVIFDLAPTVDVNVVQVRPNDLYGYRLVVDLTGRDETARWAVVTAPPRPEKFIVAIDPGHGGEDPGAIGAEGTPEKAVTLAVARKLEALVDSDPAMGGVLTRKGDYFVSLRRRTAIARSIRANLFISIHADAFPDRSVRGSSVYTLSLDGASSEMARWLSNRENAVDLIGGVSLGDKGKTVARILLDLSMTNSIADSRQLATDILRALHRVGRVHINRVEYAGFAVLKSPDIPSVLVESAFLSNPSEERLLRTDSYQRKVASAIYQGIRRYYERTAPGARPAVYVVKHGDTLIDIARRYRVSVSAIKQINKLSDDTVRIGQKLRIPRS